jgi:hypothetical protein
MRPLIHALLSVAVAIGVIGLLVHLFRQMRRP